RIGTPAPATENEQDSNHRKRSRRRRADKHLVTPPRPDGRRERFDAQLRAAPGRVDHDRLAVLDAGVCAARG
ncbi:MAG: hypothetical protein ACYCUF_11160, partial [Acidimicrobiales bacterium]